MSTPKLIAIRAEPGLSETLYRANELGLDIIGEPLFAGQPRKWDAQPLMDCDALLAGSANLFRYDGGKLDDLKHLPVHAVGPATANAATERGFTVTQVSERGLQDILDRRENATLHYARTMGQDHTRLIPGERQRLSEVVVYEMVSLSVSQQCVDACVAGAIVLLHSARSARHFVSECHRVRAKRANIGVAALSGQIAAAAGGGWHMEIIAPYPSDRELLEQVGQALPDW